MAGIPGAAHAYIACAGLGAAACTFPAFTAGSATPWGAVALLAGLYALCEHPPRCRFARGAARRGTGRPAGRADRADGAPPAPAGCHFPVLLAAALLLPPAAAALAAVPGALVSPVGDRPPARPRRVWRAARIALAVWAAARTAALLGGPAAVDRTPDLPYALLPAGVAVLAFCAVLAALDGGILAAAERVPPRDAWRGLLARSLAAHAAHGLVGLVTAVLWRSPYGWPAALFTLPPMYVTCWAYAQYHRERAAHRATIRALVQAVDLKDTYTRGHSERVGRASVMIGRELGMDEDRLEVLRFAGTLHDVGKIGVPTRVLRKDGPLTREERRIIELHPEYGHEMVRGIGFLGEARAAILHHHERLDGKGYPYGLQGAEIPEPARVVAVADAFDAMTSARSYDRARPVPEALRELARCAGTQFDPVMVDALARALARHGWQTVVTCDESPPVSVPPPSRRGPAGPGTAPPSSSGVAGGGTAGSGPSRPGER
ncbi:HD-GYP domain-containing protein [Streptomyces sp. MRC013]|uniref:HD-GYP domain-containing protein n=1 Tax=Streptomyces sp. MRC013 TaxID=2898276 RepID=UPI002025CB3C|nr:HD-GYP domain-containing protein [Streptomyces sp. MRC013]URM89683.1 HD-GYP domain-containing protein [Streptomyces sp. MRC013]